MKSLPKDESQYRQDTSIQDEILVKEYFESIDFNVEKLDKDNKDNNGKKPDFQVWSEEKDIHIYAEVKSFFKQIDIIQKQQLEEDVKNKFKLITEKSWELIISKFDFRHMPADKRDDYLKLVKEKIEKDISKSDVDKENISVEGETFTFTIYDDEEINVNNVMIMGQAFSIKGRDRLRKLIRQSIKQFEDFREYKRPMILIVCNRDFFLDEDDFLQAFHGDYTVAFSRTGKNSELFYGKGASVQSKKNTRLSAVCMLEYSPKPHFVVFHNPFAEIPLPLDIFKQSGNRQRVLKEMVFEWIEH